MKYKKLQEFERLTNELQKAVEVKKALREELRKFVKKNLDTEFLLKIAPWFDKSHKDIFSFAYFTSTAKLTDYKLINICISLKDELIAKQVLKEAVKIIIEN